MSAPAGIVSSFDAVRAAATLLARAIVHPPHQVSTFWGGDPLSPLRPGLMSHVTWSTQDLSDLTVSIPASGIAEANRMGFARGVR